MSTAFWGGAKGYNTPTALSLHLHCHFLPFCARIRKPKTSKVVQRERRGALWNRAFFATAILVMRVLRVC